MVTGFCSGSMFVRDTRTQMQQRPPPTLRRTEPRLLHYRTHAKPAEAPSDLVSDGAEAFALHAHAGCILRNATAFRSTSVFAGEVVSWRIPDEEGESLWLR